ncbi:DM13 domain-containing protein [Fibrella arboris]|uniref:DM13 domain-containing protein n=1 Tax=Fibrella arboris TaxID=3242486 RepID=UPI0035223BDF
MKINFISLLLLALLAGCGSHEDPILPTTTVLISSTTSPATGTVSSLTTVATTDSTGRTLLAQGRFMNNVHVVSGAVQLYEKAGKRTLVFTDFNTDAGPDLRIYIAETTSLRNFLEVTRLEQTGNFTIELPPTADPSKQRYVLIWCKAFSVLFGNAALQ